MHALDPGLNAACAAALSEFVSVSSKDPCTGDQTTCAADAADNTEPPLLGYAERSEARLIRQFLSAEEVEECLQVTVRIRVPAALERQCSL